MFTLSPHEGVMGRFQPGRPVGRASYWVDQAILKTCRAVRYTFEAFACWAHRLLGFDRPAWNSQCHVGKELSKLLLKVG